MQGIFSYKNTELLRAWLPRECGLTTGFTAMDCHENADENRNGLLHRTERRSSIFEALLAKFPNPRGRTKALILSLFISFTTTVGDRRLLIQQVIKSI